MFAWQFSHLILKVVYDLSMPLGEEMNVVFEALMVYFIVPFKGQRSY